MTLDIDRRTMGLQRVLTSKTQTCTVLGNSAFRFRNGKKKWPFPLLWAQQLEYNLLRFRNAVPLCRTTQSETHGGQS